MYQVKVFNFKKPEVLGFASWGLVQAFLKNEKNPSHPCVITHPNGGLVFPDSPDGSPVKQAQL